MTNDELVSLAAAKLSDNKNPRKWSDSELLGYGSNAEEKFCERCHLLEESGVTSTAIALTFTGSTKKISRASGSFLADGFMMGDEIHTTSTTNAGPFTISAVTALEITVTQAVSNESLASGKVGTKMSTIFLYDGTPVYQSDSRVLRISNAIIFGESDPLTVIRNNCAAYMDYNHSGWRTADEGTPTIILTQGFGTRRVRMWNTPDADGTCLLNIYRKPKARLSATVSLEIDEQYHKYLLNWILFEAYSKNHVETEDLPRAQKHLALYENDIAEVQQILLNGRWMDTTCSPHPGAV